MQASTIGIIGLLAAATALAQETPIERGEYLLHAGGCVSCHTEDEKGAAALAGGRALESPFGIFYTPNITPDPETGIGRWSNADFLNAFWNGLSPGGQHYFPAFPFTAYTGLSREDLLAIKAYLFSLQPVKRSNREHDLPWYLSSRLAAGVWKLIYFGAARFAPDPARDAAWNRGAYLVRHLGHCGECHTPRTRLGGLIAGRELAGNPTAPDDDRAPDITPDPDSGIGRWSSQEVELFLEIGMLPDGDFVGGGMSAVIDNTTGKLTPEDRRAIAAYLQSLPASGSVEE